MFGILKYGKCQENDQSCIDERDPNNENYTREYPGFEFEKINAPFIGNMIQVMIFSLGEFDFPAVKHLDDFGTRAFWIVWFVIIIMTCIILLNFIIAEVNESY